MLQSITTTNFSTNTISPWTLGCCRLEKANKWCKLVSTRSYFESSLNFNTIIMTKCSRCCQTPVAWVHLLSYSPYFCLHWKFFELEIPWMKYNLFLLLRGWWFYGNIWNIIIFNKFVHRLIHFLKGRWALLVGWISNWYDLIFTICLIL